MNALARPRHARITTRGGLSIDLLDPDPKCIVLQDVAVGLSRRARWSGQTRSFLSVAEHSIAVAMRAEQLAAEAGMPHSLRSAASVGGLVHDASEAYFPDVPSPLKPHLFVGKETFAAVEERLLRVVRRVVGLPETWWEQVAPLVKRADREILRIEADTQMHGVEHWNMPPERPTNFPWVPECWHPSAAATVWLDTVLAERALFGQRRANESGSCRVGVAS